MANRRPFRIPLSAAYTQRISAINTQGGSSGIVGVGIVGLMTVGGTVGTSTGSANKDARFINCFSETITDPITGKKRVYTVKRPGWGVNSTPAAGSIGNDIFIWTGETGNPVISAFGATNSTVYNGITSLGAITGRVTGLTETKVGANVPTIVTASSDSTGWYYDTVTAAFTKIADTDFPGNAGKTLAGTFCHMDGYACIMDTTGVLWASDLNSVTAWTATSFDTANAYPDAGVAAVRHGHMIMCFGTQSLQFFYNAGLTPFPFAKETAKTVKVGAISADAIARISDTTFWAGSTPEGGLSIFQYDGSVSRISTPEIDGLLILAGTTNISLTTTRYYGRSFVRVKAAASVYVFCIEEKFWFEETMLTQLATKTASISIGGTMVNYAISNISTLGKVFVQNHASLNFTDNGEAYGARIQLPPMDHGTARKKFWEDVTLIADREATTSPITLFYSDDDYQTYTVREDGDLSADQVYWTRLGASKRRAWGILHQANTPMRIEALEGNYEIGV